VSDGGDGGARSLQAGDVEQLVIEKARLDVAHGRLNSKRRA